jgi:ComF family protein
MRIRLDLWPQRVFQCVSAMLPSSCALCGASGEEALCRDCHARFFSTHRRRCTRCALPLAHAAETHTCGDCLAHPPAFDATMVAADYAPPIDQMVLALKFAGRLALAPLCARLLHAASLQPLSDAPERPSCLIAVPLGPQRLRERGFNQSLEIAGPLARALGIPLERRLALRHRDTEAQARLHPDERRQNIRGAFAIAPDAAARIRGRHIGVVDDVITTGQTLNELAATLKRYGALRVTNFVFARTLPK